MFDTARSCSTRGKVPWRRTGLISPGIFDVPVFRVDVVADLLRMKPFPRFRPRRLLLYFVNSQALVLPCCANLDTQVGRKFAGSVRDFVNYLNVTKIASVKMSSFHGTQDFLFAYINCAGAYFAVHTSGLV